ncbi:TraR/DksA C4-type zinc finger protein [Reichenbachiella sp. MALMAid0571]|uniref:TraR/DksA family transcriptional regulator n=1 Tax=Reichenbachiella sp. MALMAid0571 TaxID=3143939 RepID=UPI0032E00C52
MELNKDEIRLKIEEEILKTERSIRDLIELTQPVSPENAIGRISRMDAINNKTINDASLLKSKEKLKNLKIALEKLDTPDFGICIKCKGNIPIGRIMLMPHANKCVKCA